MYKYMIKRNIVKKGFVPKELLLIILVIFIGGMMLVGCGTGSSLSNSMGISRKSNNELMDYLGVELEKVNSLLEEQGFLTSINESLFEESEYRSIDIINGNNVNNYERLAMMSSQEGKYVDYITIYDVAESLSILGIHAGMNVNQAIEILDENGYKFSDIYDCSNEKIGDYQEVFYKKNGVYQIVFDIYGGGGINPYGSLDESDIHTEGMIGRISSSCLLPVHFRELVNEVGDRDEIGVYLVDSINDECVGLTRFTENNFFNVQGVDTYGTYIFGENVIMVELQPGGGDLPYPTRICINDVCPYKLCGIYYNMDRESALAQMSELGITTRIEEEDKIVYDVDSYTTLEIRFVDGYVNFIECIDEYPENHEKRYIEY